MEQKNPRLGVIAFAVMFGIAVSMDISSWINSKLFKDAIVETSATKMSSPNVNFSDSKSFAADKAQSVSRTNFSNINRDNAKPNYPQPTIKLLIFKEHADKQLQKLPVSITFA